MVVFVTQNSLRDSARINSRKAHSDTPHARIIEYRDGKFRWENAKQQMVHLQDFFRR